MRTEAESLVWLNDGCTRGLGVYLGCADSNGLCGTRCLEKVRVFEVSERIDQQDGAPGALFRGFDRVRYLGKPWASSPC